MNADKVYASYLGGNDEEPIHFIHALKVYLIEGGDSDNFTDASSADISFVNSSDSQSVSDINDVLESGSSRSNSSMSNFAAEEPDENFVERKDINEIDLNSIDCFLGAGDDDNSSVTSEPLYNKTTI